MKRVTAGEVIPAGALVACNEEGEAVNGEPFLIDPSGWETWTDEAARTKHARLTVTERGMRAMSARQRDDLQRGWALIERAFTPDKPIGYEQ